MHIYNLSELDQINFELKNYKAAIIETDTVFAIVSLYPKLIYKIKNRNKSKKLIKFIYSLSQIPALTNHEKTVIEKYIPGALTIIKNNQGYRIPNHKELIELIKLCDHLYSSSANISRAKPINRYEDALSIFHKHSDNLIVVKGSVNEEGIPSTIVNLDTLKVIRNGLIDGNEIIKQLKEKE
jgi:L-threonylcarbamoyladenylate synthase